MGGISNYYPGGSIMPGRNFSSGDYRYGFNGQEKDDEVKNATGTHLNFKFRGYDSRLGRFWSRDPLAKDYPWNSPYVFAENDVIRSIDLEGAEKLIQINNKQTMKSSLLTLKTAGALGSGVLEVSISVNGSASLQYAAPVNYNAKTGEVSGGGTTDISAYTAGRLGLGSALLSNDNVSQNVKSEMMRGIIHQGQDDFINTSLEASGGVLEQVGDGVEITGRVISLAPGGQLFGGGLVVAGEGMSNLGSLLTGVSEIRKGNTNKGGFKLATTAASYLLGNSINKLEDSEKITGLDNNILQGVVKMHDVAAEKVGEKIEE